MYRFGEKNSLSTLQENSCSQAAPRGRTQVEWELCTVLYFSSLPLSTVLAYFGFSSCYLLVQKHRLRKIVYRPMWFSLCTKFFPLLTSEVICVKKKFSNRINCTRNMKDGFSFWLANFDQPVTFLWSDFLWNGNATTKNNLAQSVPPLNIIVLILKNKNKHIKRKTGKYNQKKYQVTIINHC